MYYRQSFFELYFYIYIDNIKCTMIIVAFRNKNKNVICVLLYHKCIYWCVDVLIQTNQSNEY